MLNTTKNIGSLLKSIPTVGEKENIELSDLIASKEFIANHLASLNATYQAEILEQPTSLGLALIASYYNQKGDQNSKIYIASTMNDFQHIVLTIGTGPNNKKLVVIFEPTDNNGVLKEKCPQTHKVVIYLENKDTELHIVIADSTNNYESIRTFCKTLVNTVLPDMPKKYYTLLPVLDPEKNTPLQLQSDYWSCGTHAFRIARVMAKSADFLASIKIADNKHSDHAYNIEIPISFAKCADNAKARDACVNFYGDAFTSLPSFTKYKGNYDYINTFTKKYILIITKCFLNMSQEELLKQITDADAKNYSNVEILTTNKLTV